MGDFNIKRKGQEVIIRLNINDLDKSFLEKLKELLFWEYAFRKAGFSETEIQHIFEESRQVSKEPLSTKQPLTEADIKEWTDDIERQWWSANADQLLKDIAH